MLFYIPILLTKNCFADADCWSINRPDIHSLYCVDGTCQKLLGPGENCIKPSDCASYFYFGPLACSARCRAENECDKIGIIQITSKYCCRPVPEDRECLPNRPNLLNGCNVKQGCLMDDNGTFKCKSGNLNDWIYGVILSISGNLGINIGINLQKRSYKHPCLKFVDLKIDTLTFGALLYAIGKILSFAAYIYGNQSLLASLSAFGLISNSIFAPLINKEVFTYKDFLSIVFVLGGSSVIMANSGRSNKVYSLCELLKMYTTTENLVWFSSLFALIIILYLVVKYVEVNSDWSFPDDKFEFFKRENTFYEDTSVMLKYLMLIFYVAISALIGAFTSLFAKSFGEMVEKTIAGDNQFIFSVTYLFFFLLVTFTFWQIYWLNRALRHYDALLTLPVFHAMWTILSMFNAGIFFSDFEYFTYNQFYGFGLGMILIFIGSLFLASRVKDKDKVKVLKIESKIVVEKKED